MSIYGNLILDECNNTELDTLEEGVVGDIARKIANTEELKAQWKQVADKFVKHKWIYRYIDAKQKEQLEKHYANLTNEEVSYKDYKKSFKYIANFMGVPADKIIIENMIFSKDKKDKEQDIVAIKYSKGLAKVIIPDGVKLIHVSPVENIKELIPSFRSKVKGKYMYPTKRCFFTVAKDINPKKAGLEKKKTYRYTPKNQIKTAYIDPTYADFGNGSVYVELDNGNIPVENYDKKLEKLLKAKKKEDKK